MAYSMGRNLRTDSSSPSSFPSFFSVGNSFFRSRSPLTRRVVLSLPSPPPAVYARPRPPPDLLPLGDTSSAGVRPPAQPPAREAPSPFIEPPRPNLLKREVSSSCFRGGGPPLPSFPLPWSPLTWEWSPRGDHGRALWPPRQRQATRSALGVRGLDRRPRATVRPLEDLAAAPRPCARSTVGRRRGTPRGPGRAFLAALNRILMKIK